jgi:hypothetical protein
VTPCSLNKIFVEVSEEYTPPSSGSKDNPRVYFIDSGNGALSFSTRSVNLYQTTRCNIEEIIGKAESSHGAVSFAYEMRLKQGT